MDDRWMRQRVQEVLDWFAWEERQWWARKIAISSAAAAGLGLGLAGLSGCPEQLRPPTPDAGQPAVVRPVLDPAQVNEYGVIAQPPVLPDDIPRPLYAEEPPPRPPMGKDPAGLGSGAEDAVLNPNPRPEVVSKYAAPMPKPKPLLRPKYGIQRPPQDLNVEGAAPSSRPHTDIVARYAARFPRQVKPGS